LLLLSHSLSLDQEILSAIKCVTAILYSIIQAFSKHFPEVYFNKMQKFHIEKFQPKDKDYIAIIIANILLTYSVPGP
jgi:hypothetical protein